MHVYLNTCTPMSLSKTLIKLIRCPWGLMMTSSNGNIFRVTGPLCGEFTGPGEFPTQRPVTRSFDVFFELRLNKRLSKQPWSWWFETPSLSLWRHCYVLGGRTRVLDVSSSGQPPVVYTVCHMFTTLFWDYQQFELSHSRRRCNT